jgi:hypothetical protein
MNRLEYNILLEEAGIYDKRKLDKNVEIDSASELIYEESETKDRYEIIPGDISSEEIKIALLAKQTKDLKSIHSCISWITAIIVISFVLGMYFLIEFTH